MPLRYRSSMPLIADASISLGVSWGELTSSQLLAMKKQANASRLLHTDTNYDSTISGSQMKYLRLIYNSTIN